MFGLFLVSSNGSFFWRVCVLKCADIASMEEESISVAMVTINFLEELSLRRDGVK